MKRSILPLIFLISVFQSASGQFYDERPQKVYKANLKIDLPIAIATSALTAHGFYRITQNESPSLDRVNSLDFGSVSGFNQFFMDDPQYSKSAEKVSEAFFYGAFPIGLGTALIDKNMRSDFWTIALMYWETFGIIGTIYSQTAASVDKFRPLAYPGSGAPREVRTEDNAKDSFPGGHPTITAAATFFSAKIISDYYPNRKGLHIAAYSVASALTLTNVYLRHRAGKHFASDLLVGLAYSVPISILVPELHKIANRNDQLSLFSGPNGMTLRYTIE